MEHQDATVEEILARIARRQHGLVTRKQLLAAGISKEEIRRRIQKGALLVVHRGVYRVGHRAPSIEARYLAAVLACGDGAVLSGQAAGYLWGLIKGTAPPPEVTAPKRRKVRGVRTRQARHGEINGTKWRGVQSQPSHEHSWTSPHCCSWKTLRGPATKRAFSTAPHPAKSRKC
jgi:hypothetical protein